MKQNTASSSDPPIVELVTSTADIDQSGATRVRSVESRGGVNRPRHHPARRSVGVRPIPVILLTVLMATACRSGSRSPGASFVGASLLEPLSEAEATHDELLRADLGRADSVTHRGLADGLAVNFTDDVVYLRGGLPIVRGRLAARGIFSVRLRRANTAA